MYVSLGTRRLEKSLPKLELQVVVCHLTCAANRTLVHYKSIKYSGQRSHLSTQSMCCLYHCHAWHGWNSIPRRPLMIPASSNSILMCPPVHYQDWSLATPMREMTGSCHSWELTKKQLWLPYCLLPLIPHSGGTKLLCWEHPPVMGSVFLPYRLLATVQSGKSLQAQESPEKLWWPVALKGSAKVHVHTEPEARSHPGAQSWGTTERVCACYCSDLLAEKT